MDMGRKVSLGCGTLILIVLIVLIFGNLGSKDVEREVRGLRQEVVELRRAISDQEEQIRRLRMEVQSLIVIQEDHTGIRRVPATQEAPLR